MSLKNLITLSSAAFMAVGSAIEVSTVCTDAFKAM